MQPSLLTGVARPFAESQSASNPSVSHTPFTILCVDEDRYLTDLLRYALKREGFDVEIASCGRDALQYAQKAQPDVVLLEAELPDADGFQLCAHFRYVLRIPVIMLSMRHSEEDIILGLTQGADDYVVKPFSMRILMFRLRVLLRRLETPTPILRTVKRSYRVGHGWFDTEREEVVAGVESVKLTPTEARILHLLITHEGRVLSAGHMLEQLWSQDSDTTGAVIKTHIRHLRAKLTTVLGEDAQVIQTISGAGYTFRQVGSLPPQRRLDDVWEDAG